MTIKHNQQLLIELFYESLIDVKIMYLFTT